MKFQPLPLQGAWLIEAEPITDERGFFTRIIDRQQFQSYGLNSDLLQASMSHNTHRGTLRGMHLQVTPFAETKLIRVTSGSILDVIIDLRKNSSTYLEHFAVTLRASEPAILYVPEGFAHGFQTLADHTEVYYHMNQVYHGPSARSFLWSDLQFGIEWPFPTPILSPKDASAPVFDPQQLSAI